MSPRSEKAFDGEIRQDGQFFASGAHSSGGKNNTFEWRGQILSTRTALGTALLRGDKLCQFLLTLKQN